jgi:hypothetical protein
MYLQQHHCVGLSDKYLHHLLQSNPKFSQRPLAKVRISDLRERLTLSFGEAWAPSFSADIAISLLCSRSVNEALKDGYEADEIWKAVCKEHPVETEKFR